MEGKQIYYLSKMWNPGPPFKMNWVIYKTSSPNGITPNHCYYDNYWLAHAEVLKRNE